MSNEFEEFALSGPFDEAKIRDLIKRQASSATHTQTEVSDKLSASEAVFGVLAWLSTRDIATVIGAHHDCAVIADFAKRFCEANNLAEPREGWDENLTHPVDVETHSESSVALSHPERDSFGNTQPSPYGRAYAKVRAATLAAGASKRGFNVEFDAWQSAVCLGKADPGTAGLAVWLERHLGVKLTESDDSLCAEGWPKDSYDAGASKKVKRQRSSKQTVINDPNGGGVRRG